MITRANGTDNTNLNINSHIEMIEAKAKRKKNGDFAKERTMKDECIFERVRKMVALRDEFMKFVDELHVQVMKGNSKTGERCYTVSLIPVADCCNCKECMNDCYDARNDCIYEDTIRTRAINSAIHKADPKRYWKEISNAIKVIMITELRINVGGDLTEKDFYYIEDVARENPGCDILLFTKNYDGANNYLDERGGIWWSMDNYIIILSVWEGMEIDNRHDLPCSHVLHVDGRTTAPDFKSVYCGGNCTACHYHNEGCWALKAKARAIMLEKLERYGIDVVFLYH